MEQAAPLRLVTRAAALLAMIATPSLAAAQGVAPAGMAKVSWAKSEAILGTSSKLASILAVQQGRLTPAATQVPQPASYGVVPTLAQIRTERFFSPAVTSGRPDVFGSVALKVRRTPLDHRWRSAGRTSIGGAPAAYASALRSLDPVARASAVNRYVNGRVQFVDDSVQYGRRDYWTAAGETLRRGRGDCEDYAIAKLQMLRAAGVADKDLYLVILKDLVRRSDHAVLVVRAGGRMLVLDNGTNKIVDTETVSDYRPIMTFAAGGSWIHGYRRQIGTPLNVAAAMTAAPLAPSAAR